jgi:plasmid stabilization system protein ParE
VITYRVVFTPESAAQLNELYRFIATTSSPERALSYLSYVGGVMGCCESLRHFLDRGAKRDDSRPGMRITHYRRRTTLLFRIQASVVTILGVFHRGQDDQGMLESGG